MITIGCHYDNVLFDAYGLLPFIANMSNDITKIILSSVGL